MLSFNQFKEEIKNMKTLILTLAAVQAFGTLSYQIADAGPGPGRGYGGCGNGPSSGRSDTPPDYGDCAGGQAFNEQDSTAREKFFSDSSEIRKQIFELRQQYAETLNTDPVDKTAAEGIWSQIFDLQTEIRKMATESDLFLGGPGYCLGPEGYYEGDADKSSFNGNRGFGSQGGRWNNI